MSGTRESKARARALGERVSLALTKHHDGNVHQAALLIGIPYRTLGRLAAGQIANPRADAIRRLSEFYGTTTDWLLDGRGPTPAWATDRPTIAPTGKIISVGEGLAWKALLNRLSLPPDLYDAASLIPTAALNALWEVPDASPILRAGKGGKDVPRATEGLALNAMRAEYRLWRELVEGVEERYGRNAAVDLLKAALRQRDKSVTGK